MSKMSIGAMNQLADALENAGWTAEDVTRLKQFGKLGKVRDVLSGVASVTYPEHLIDTDASPFIPNGWSVEEHNKGGFFMFNSGKGILYLSKKQKKGSIGRYDLRKELNRSVMNANVLDYLLAHPELIPESWKSKNIYFWGTIYRCSGRRNVRYLYWYGSKWYDNYRQLAYAFLF